MNEKIRNAYTSCRQCNSMDPILQPDLVEAKRAEYIKNITDLHNQGVVDSQELERYTSECNDCIQGRKVDSVDAKIRMNGFEELGLTDPFNNQKD